MSIFYVSYFSINSKGSQIWADLSYISNTNNLSGTDINEIKIMAADKHTGVSKYDIIILNVIKLEV